jgi:c-di-GMP-binding flagellar brake protein YcgR
MDIDLVKDLIKSRREHLIFHLAFYFGRTSAQIYPDYKMESLDSPDVKQFLTSCSRGEMEILKASTTELKMQELKRLMQIKYNMNVTVTDSPDRYHISLRTMNK